MAWNRAGSNGGGAAGFVKKAQNPATAGAIVLTLGQGNGAGDVPAGGAFFFAVVGTEAFTVTPVIPPGAENLPDGVELPPCNVRLERKCTLTTKRITECEFLPVMGGGGWLGGAAAGAKDVSSWRGPGGWTFRVSENGERAFLNPPVPQ